MLIGMPSAVLDCTQMTYIWPAYRGTNSKLVKVSFVKMDMLKIQHEQEGKEQNIGQFLSR